MFIIRFLEVCSGLNMQTWPPMNTGDLDLLIFFSLDSGTGSAVPWYRCYLRFTAVDSWRVRVHDVKKAYRVPGNQRPSEAIRCRQKPREAIQGGLLSDAICWRPSEALGGHVCLVFFV